MMIHSCPGFDNTRSTRPFGPSLSCHSLNLLKIFPKMYMVIRLNRFCRAP
ncbi:unnamed protein product [Periconia digitata]|uniref:Uncharacterized protein n=1 Tax=Periconia digitata TaxID=1303443 RepID=A0A9W4UTC4_9PLEO|nr:unnamed protein product [Periconia digitata]